MPSRRKINLEMILASLNLICPKCQAEIEPSLVCAIEERKTSPFVLSTA